LAVDAPLGVVSTGDRGWERERQEEKGCKKLGDFPHVKRERASERERERESARECV
jgi:hypothetical protein